MGMSVIYFSVKLVSAIYILHKVWAIIFCHGSYDFWDRLLRHARRIRVGLWRERKKRMVEKAGKNSRKTFVGDSQDATVKDGTDSPVRADNDTDDDMIGKTNIVYTIKGNTFFLIIENKINGACEQQKQIDRYVRIAQQTYPSKQIYVLYLGGETNIFPSENSMSLEIQRLINDRIICRNYKDDIIKWIALAYKQVEFKDQPFLKSTLLLYKTYLENKYNINNQYKAMNNKLDKTLIEMLGLKTISLDEKINVIQDQITNIDKIKERLSDMLQDCKNQLEIRNVKDWYEQCTTVFSNNPILTMENNMEFGFNFMYRNTNFRCCVSFDDNKDPYWGIKGLDEDIDSRPKIFEELQKWLFKAIKDFIIANTIQKNGSYRITKRKSS